MQKSIRNFLFLSLIAASAPVNAAPTSTNPIVQKPATKEQQELNTQLIKAINEGKIDQIKQLLVRGADANTKNQEGVPALTVATCYFYEQSEKIASQYGVYKFDEEVTSLFNQGKIIMYNAQFTDRIVKLLQDYSNINFGLPFKQIEYIDTDSVLY